MKAILLLALVLGIFVGGVYAGVTLAGESPGDLVNEKWLDVATISDNTATVANPNNTPQAAPTVVSPRPTPTRALLPTTVIGKPVPTLAVPTPLSTKSVIPEPSLQTITLEVTGTGASGLFVRTSPEIYSDNILGKVFDGTKFRAEPETVQGDGYAWHSVQLKGWAATDWLDPVSGPGVTVEVRGTGDAGLRVRSTPVITDANVLGKLHDGSRVTVIGESQTGSGYLWWPIVMEGWAATKYLANSSMTAQEEFLQFALPLAEATFRDSHVPVPVALAQAAHETGWGTSYLALTNNNYFGIKCAGLPEPTACAGGYRAYETPEASFVDYGRFLRSNPRYAEAFNHLDEPLAFLREIAKAGYAEDSGYFDKIRAVMDEYHLTRFHNP